MPLPSDSIGNERYNRVAQKKVDHHAVCEYNLRKLLLAMVSFLQNVDTTDRIRRRVTIKN